jgi:dimethylamine/trimethylamine dehydrogenase
VVKKDVTGFRDGAVELVCVYSDAVSTLPCRSLVTVTSRLTEDALYRELAADPAALAKAGIRTLKAIGDCWAPAAIVQAVYAGHRYARELDAPVSEAPVPFRRELPREVAVP